VLLSLSLFGRVHIALDDVPITHWAYDKVPALLAYLALESDQPQRRNVLAEVLWPDTHEQTARKNLRQALTVLRKLIVDAHAQPPFLLSTRETLRFNPASWHTLDVAMFSKLLDACEQHHQQSSDICAACISSLEQAIDLYHGDFLGQFSLRDSDVFEEWIARKREQLRSRALDALTLLYAWHEQQGAYAAAERYARRHLELDPWCESARRCLMRVLAQTRRRSAALVQYDACCRVLAADLHVQPEAETVALYESILANDFGAVVELERTVGEPLHASPTTTNHTARSTLNRRDLKSGARLAGQGSNLPAQLTSFVGREREISMLRQLLRQDARLITLVGPVGVGKTRLALRVAAEVGEWFAEGVRFVSLVALTSCAQVVGAIAQTFGIEAPDERLLVERLRQYLCEKHLLLLLDSFEHVRAAAPLVAELLISAAHLKIMITSQALLDLYGEWEFHVAPLPTPDSDFLPTPDQLHEYPSVRLFYERTRAMCPGFAISPANAQTVAMICQRLEGVPLAIELAALLCKQFTSQEVLRRLDHRLEILIDEAQNRPARHRSLRAAIAWSYDRLDAVERELFVRLAIFVGGCTAEAAAAVCLTTDERLPEVCASLAALAHRSLLRQDTGPDGESRFVMLDMIREFALEQLSETGQLEALRPRHYAYALRLAELGAAHLSGPEQALWLDRLDAEYPNLRAAFEWSITVSGGAELALRLAAALGAFWLMRGRLGEGRRLLAHGLAQPTGSQPTLARIRSLHYAGWLAEAQGDYLMAGQHHQESCVFSALLGDQGRRADALMGLGSVVLASGDLHQAQALFGESRLLYQALGESSGYIRTLYYLSVVASLQGDLAQAAILADESLAGFRALRDSWGSAYSLLQLGELALTQGDCDRAARCYTASLALHGKMRDRRGLAYAGFGLARVAHQHCDYAQATTIAEECLSLFRALGDRRGMAAVLAELGSLALTQGQHERAATHCRESLQLWHSMR